LGWLSGGEGAGREGRCEQCGAWLADRAGCTGRKQVYVGPGGGCGVLREERSLAFLLRAARGRDLALVLRAARGAGSGVRVCAARGAGALDRLACCRGSGSGDRVGAARGAGSGEPLACCRWRDLVFMFLVQKGGIWRWSCVLRRGDLSRTSRAPREERDLAIVLRAARGSGSSDRLGCGARSGISRSSCALQRGGSRVRLARCARSGIWRSSCVLREERDVAMVLGLAVLNLGACPPAGIWAEFAFAAGEVRLFASETAASARGALVCRGLEGGLWFVAGWSVRW
jgi:hypothetical protein